MSWIALKMLTGNRGKYLGMIVGVAVAAWLIVQQCAIFCGVMQQTANQIRDVHDAQLWVMDPNVNFADDIKGMSETDLYRIRGVSGVEWAVRMFKGLGRAQLDNGNFYKVILLGIDDGSLVGGPQTMVVGKLTDISQPDAVIIDEAGYKQLWPGEPVRLGRIFEMNDRRAMLVGLCKASPTFQTYPIVYTRYSQATFFIPVQRKNMAFVLAKAQDGILEAEFCRRIFEQTGFRRPNKSQFTWKTMDYFLRNTGIPLNFGVTALLALVVGTTIVGQTFYLFTVENLYQFAALKALGVRNARLLGMILLQAGVVGLIGYGLGVGSAALFGEYVIGHGRLAFFLPWQVLVIAGAAVLLIVTLSSVLSLRRVLVLEPAQVFKS